jgi:hypothetical protein
LNKAVQSGEAVNGVAFLKRWMMVSARDEVMLWTLPADGSTEVKGASFPLGSHGVIAGLSGYFFAPLGRSGLMICRPQEGEVQSVDINEPVSDDTYFYRVTSFNNAAGQEVIACATRRGGVGVMEFRGADHKHALTTATFAGLDVVDLCTIRTDAGSTALAAVGRDGALVLFRDALHDRHPVTIRYEAIEGTVYRLLSAHGYLFVLTSKAMYVIADLVSSVGGRVAFNRETPVLALPMEAVDANLVGDRWVFIVMPDRVLRLDVELLSQAPKADGPESQVRSMRPDWLHPDWQQREIEQKTLSVAASG